MHPALAIINLILAATLEGDSGGLVDPTRPVDYVPAAALAPALPEGLTDWRLTAVRIGASDRTAVLNGKVVRAGDAVGRARVVDIRPGTVVVEFDRKQLEVRLHGVGVKKKANPEQGKLVKP